jgi:transcriptional regulator with XRE-family HTH domain
MMLNSTKIKAAREAAKLTQQEAGEAAGFPTKTARQRWNNYETGREVNPKLDVVERIAKAVGLPVAEILE